jgi:hypothetical protein
VSTSKRTEKLSEEEVKEIVKAGKPVPRVPVGNWILPNGVVITSGRAVPSIPTHPSKPKVNA